MSQAASLINFNAGELSELLRCRPDLDKFSSGASVLENFIVLPQGAARNRTGSVLVAAAGDETGAVRLIPFEFSAEDSLLLEFGNLYVRFFKRGVPVTNLDAPVQVTTPYPADKLDKLAYVQSGDVLYLVHPEYPPARLERYADDNWLYRVINFEGGPFQEENRETTTVTPSAVTGAITLAASDDIFVPEMAGELFQVTYPNLNNSLTPYFTSNATSGTLSLKGKWNLTTSGGWYGTLTLERSYDDGATWSAVRSWISSGDKNFDTEGEEFDNGVLYRLSMSNWREPEGLDCHCTVNFQSARYWINGIVRILSVASGTSAQATVLEDLGGTTATTDWAFGAWNDRCGYPAHVAFFQDRLVLGGTMREPQTLRFSATGDYHNFHLGEEADDAMTYTIRTVGLNAVSWMIPMKRGLAVGTAAGEGIFGPADGNEPLAPDNRQWNQETNAGSAELPPVNVNSSILFLQRGGEHLRELSYDFGTDGYQSPDVSALNPEVLAGGVREAAWTSLSFPALWMVRADGQLIGFTYDRLQNVTAFHRHLTDGIIESVAVVREGGADRIYIAVRRGSRLLVERFALPDERCYLDAAVIRDGETATAELSGLDHLEGRAIRALADGSTVFNLTVSGGSITLPRPAKRIVAGLPFVSRLVSMPIEFVGQGGATIGLVKKAAGMKLYLHQSAGGRAGRDGGTMTELDLRHDYHAGDDPVPDYTGPVDVIEPGNWRTGERIAVEQHLPLPFTLLGIAHDTAVVG